MFYRFSLHVSFQKATYHSSPLIFWTGSPPFRHILWLSSPLCNLPLLGIVPKMGILTIEPQVARGIPHFFFFFFFLFLGGCRTFPTTNLPFVISPSSLVTPVWYFCPPQWTQGWTKPESVLFDHDSAVCLFIGFFVMFGDTLKKNIRIIEDFWVAFSLFHLSSFFFSNGGSDKLLCWKVHFKTLFLNNYVHTYHPDIVLFKFRSCLKPPWTTLTACFLHQLSIMSHYWHLPFIQHVMSYLGVFEYWTCKYFKYLNCGSGQFDKLELWAVPEQCEM